MVTIVSRFDPSKVLWKNDARDNLSEADLSRANLSWANLSEADLSKADLSWANLSEADLSKANLSEANLYGANLSWANLYGANLSWANLYGANLSEAKILDQFNKEVMIRRLLTQVDRQNGGYRFHAFELASGGILIKAGCRTFNTTNAYRDHVKAEYANTPKARETLAILAFIDSLVEI